MPHQELRELPRTRWVQLGDLLTRRRIDIDRRYLKRAVFARERNVNYRLIFDIENAKRQDFGAAVLILLEVAYRLPIGSIRQFLTGDTDGLSVTDDESEAVPAA